MRSHRNSGNDFRQYQDDDEEYTEDSFLYVFSNLFSELFKRKCSKQEFEPLAEECYDEVFDCALGVGVYLSLEDPDADILHLDNSAYDSV